MNKEDLLKLKEFVANLSEEDKKERDIYLARLARGELQGPLVGYPSIDKNWFKYYTDDQIRTDMPKMTAYRYLYECNKDYPDNISISYYGKKVTFRDFFAKIDETARALKAIGVKENDIISISMPNTPEGVYLFYAVSKIGAIANMIDPRTSAEGIQKYIEEVHSDKVFIVDSYYNKVKTLVDSGKVDKVVAISPSESLPLALNLGYKLKESIENKKDPSKKIDFSDKTINWKNFIANGRNYYGKIEADYVPNRAVVIEHTGGTTGKPKGVMLTNESINAVALQSVLTGIDMQREHNWLDIMPTFIAYGVAMGLHLPLTIGMETFLIPQFDAQKFDELLLKYKPIHMVGVPSYWGTIIKSKKLAKKDLSYMIAPTVGGDAMDITLEEESNEYLKNHNCSSKIVKGYGMTEVAGGVSGTVDDNNEIGSVGIPFVDSTIAIFEPGTENELGYSEDGEVCITGPNIMLGYYDNPEATAEILRKHADGSMWIHSGDIGHINQKGSLFIVDRIKRMMIRYDGFKVFPSIIENVIGSHPAVEMCKVVSIADSEHTQGRLPKAHIVLKQNNNNDVQSYQEHVLHEIKQLCAKKLPEYALPVDYKFRDTLPLTPIGKVDYISLEKEDENIVNLPANKVLKKTL